MALRIVVGVAGVLLLGLAIERVATPSLIGEAMAALGTATGQWIGVGLLAMGFIAAALHGVAV